MSGPSFVVSEEPVRSNSNITSLDERSQRLLLAEFSVENVCRYSLVWERAASVFDDESLGVLVALAEILSVPTHFVVGWKHQADGPLRIRHLQLRSFLTKTGWLVHTENRIGLAGLETAPGSLADIYRAIASRDVGWFLAFGDWASVTTLVQPPFRNTIEFFCWNHRLAPSLQFLNGVGVCSGAVAYRTAGDDQKPAVHLVTCRRVGQALAERFPTLRVTVHGIS